MGSSRNICHTGHVGARLASATVPTELRPMCIRWRSSLCASARYGALAWAGATLSAKLRTTGVLWSAFPRAFACQCAPLGNNSAGAIVLAECAPALRAGFSHLRAMAAPRALAMLDDEKTPSTNYLYRCFISSNQLTPLLQSLSKNT